LHRRLAEVVTGARTLDDSLRALHRWVAQDFRYVSLSLGIGGYRPRLPAEVLDTKYGDCKDKATLFIALARQMGVAVYPVLASSSGSADSTMPSASEFDHMIAAVERPGSGYQFVDLTAELAPWGELPPAEQGSFALIVHPDGRGESVVLPQTPVTASKDETLIEGELAPDGTFNGRLVHRATGDHGYNLRFNFANRVDSADLATAARAIATAVFPGAAGDSLRIFDGRDLHAEPRVSIVLRNGRATSHAGASDILTLPIRDFAPTALVSDLEGRGPRRFPIDVEAVSGNGIETQELRVKLPPGWRARLPDNVHTASVFGEYRAEYTQNDRLLRIVREVTGARGVQPPERVGDLLAWLRDMAKDDVRYIVLEHGT
jgi:hypothetical protein